MLRPKTDESPLTQADMASHNIIDAALRELTPDIPIISEESGLPDFEIRGQWSRYWLIDPLDGTREFVNRNGEFTVNIALIDDKRPLFGVVHVPVHEKTYYGCEGVGAFLQLANGEPASIQVSAESASPVRVVGSRSHRGASLDAYLDNLGDVEMLPMGSSLKILRCRRRRCGHLSAPWTYLGMGHGGSPGGRRTGRRRSRRTPRGPTPV